MSEPIQTPDDILFIGNSYTLTNSMPWTLAKMVKASGAGNGFNIEVVAEGGKRLEQHWYETGALERLRARPWDYVVIQEHSTTPLHDWDGFMEYGVKFAQEAKRAGAQTVLYETWARGAGHSVYKSNWSRGNPHAMQAALRDAYQKLADKTGSLYVPVGDTWERLLNEQDSVRLYDPDLHHPSELGSFLAACVFYSVLTGRNPEDCAYTPPGVLARDSKLLKYYAARIF